MVDTPQVDDLSIGESDELLRRIPAYHIIFDHNLGRERPTSAAFEDSPDGTPMSVVVRKDIEDPASVVAEHENFSLAELTAGEVRVRKQGVCRFPKMGEPGHAHVFGKKTDSTRKFFATTCRWIIRAPSAAPNSTS